MNISVFMEKVGCTKWPDRWKNFYDSVSEDFEKNGCVLTDPGYYDEIHEKYGVLNVYFVYGNPDAEIETLPEETHLHKALKKHFLSGKAIYSVGGYFF